MSILKVDTIKTSDGSGNLTVPNATGTLLNSDASGNVGIGTSSPGLPLDVINGVRSENFYSLSYAGVPGSTSAFGAGTISTDPNWGMYFKSQSGAAQAEFAFTNSAGTDRLRIDSSGNLKFNSGYGSVATAYGCRAWVNYDANASTIRASGNVSSLTNLSSAADIVNFTTAMPDANYAVSTSGNGSTVNENNGRFVCSHSYTTTSVRLVAQQASNSAAAAPIVCASIHR